MTRERVQGDTERQYEIRSRNIWRGVRTLSLFVLTAILLSGWWEVQMVANHGGPFLLSWWTGQTALTLPETSVQPFWLTWLRQNSMICGWVVIGLLSAVREIRFPSSEHLRHRNQFVVCWWLTALGIRFLFELPVLKTSLLIESWNGLLLLPTALLAATGIRSLVLRELSPVMEAVLLISTLGLCVWRITNQPLLGAVGFVVGFLFVALLPTIVARIRRYSLPWTERDWKRILRVVIIGQLVLHLAAGFIEYPGPSSDSLSLVELRRRISTINSVPRVTLMTLNKVPESLLFILRSHWPASQFIMAGSHDGSTVSDILASNSSTAAANEIVIEWTRRDSRLATEFMPNRQTEAIGDPLKFRERRIMIYRVGPKEQ